MHNMKYGSPLSHRFLLEVTVVRLKSCSTNFYTVFQKLIFFVVVLAIWHVWDQLLVESCGTSCWWSLFLLLSLTSLEYGILFHRVVCFDMWLK